MDTGATNRKLGSDMADSVTDGGLHGKDLSKADVSVIIWAWLKAQEEIVHHDSADTSGVPRFIVYWLNINRKTDSRKAVFLVMTQARSLLFSCLEEACK